MRVFFIILFLFSIGELSQAMDPEMPSEAQIGYYFQHIEIDYKNLLESINGLFNSNSENLVKFLALLKNITLEQNRNNLIHLVNEQALYPQNPIDQISAMSSALHICAAIRAWEVQREGQ